MTNEELDRLEALANAASSGPWVAGATSGNECSVTGPTMTIYDEGGHTESDAAFIAAARDAVPALVAEVRRLRAYERLVKKYARAIPEPAKEDVIGPIHGDRTGIHLPMNFVCREKADGFVNLDDAVRAAFAADSP